MTDNDVFWDDLKPLEDVLNKLTIVDNKPSKKEIELNNRARSAKLRFAVRSNNKFEYPQDLIKKFKRFLDLEAINV